MKNKVPLVLALSLLLVEGVATAQDKSLYGKKSTTEHPIVSIPDINYTRYLSSADRADISRRVAVEDVKARLESGTLLDDSNRGPELIEFSLPAEFTQEKGFDTRVLENSGEVRAATTVNGTISCSIRVDNPHVGTATGLPKAKSEGSCTYTPIQGAQPTTLTYELHQILIDLGLSSQGGLGFPTDVWTAQHPKFELNPFWPADQGNSGTQVFGLCPPSGSDQFSHSNVMWIFPPPPFQLTFAVPFQVGTPKVDWISC